MLAGPVRFARAWGLGWMTPVLGAFEVVARRSELGTDRGPSLLLLEGPEVVLVWPFGSFADIFAASPVLAVWPDFVYIRLICSCLLDVIVMLHGRHGRCKSRRSHANRATLYSKAD